LHLEVEVIGKSAHAAMPSTGVDALEAATAMLSDLYAIRKTYADKKSKIAGIDSPTLTVGLIAGGINTNVVPDTVKLRLDRRIIPRKTRQRWKRHSRNRSRSRQPSGPASLAMCAASCWQCRSCRCRARTN